MATKRIGSSVGRLVAACMAVSGLMASEYHGTVKSSGLALPGATVTAIQGDKKIVTTTDRQGVFTYSELEDGTWTIEVEVLGFEKIARQVGIASNAPSPEWDLKFLTEAALVAILDGGQAAPATAPTASPLPARGFQRVSVTQSSDTEAIGAEGTIKTEEIADLSPTSANSFIVQGSMSSALGIEQRNDWGPPGMGMGGPGGPGMMGMGGPGMGGPGMGGPGTDGAVGAQAGARGRLPGPEDRGCPLGPAGLPRVEVPEEGDRLPAADQVAADQVAADQVAVDQVAVDRPTEDREALAARPLVGRGVPMPWHSAMGVETRAICTWPARTSASTTRFGMHGRSPSPGPT